MVIAVHQTGRRLYDLRRHSDEMSAALVPETDTVAPATEYGGAQAPRRNDSPQARCRALAIFFSSHTPRRRNGSLQVDIPALHLLGISHSLLR